MGTTITLNEKFFERDAAAVAKDLLGGTILYRGKDGAHRYWITEAGHSPPHPQGQKRSLHRKSHCSLPAYTSG